MTGWSLDWIWDGEIFFPIIRSVLESELKTTESHLGKCEVLNKFLIEPINTVILFNFPRGIEAQEINILIHLVSWISKAEMALRTEQNKTIKTQTNKI